MNILLNVFQTIIKDIRAMSLDIIQVPLLLALNKFNTTFSILTQLYIHNFENKLVH